MPKEELLKCNSNNSGGEWKKAPLYIIFVKQNLINMNTQKNNIRFGVLSTAIMVAALSRLIPHPSNFTAIGAMALFGGCYFSDKRIAYVVTVLALFLSDVILNSFIYNHTFTLTYSGFLWIYASFILTVVMGTFIKKVSIGNVLLMGILAALLHWVISDFGVWMGSSLYTKNFAGITECYTAALPYLRNMLLGNILFSALMFGAYELAQKRFPVLAISK